MKAVGLWARAELRARWRAWLALSLLVALFFGPALAAFAGSRRTTSVYSRFLDKQHAWDVAIFDASQFGAVLWKPDFSALEHLPYVEDSVRGFTGDYLGLTFFGDLSGRYGTELNKAKLIVGRLPRADRADEVAVPVFQNVSSGDPIFSANQRALLTAPVASKVALREECLAKQPGCAGDPPTIARTLTVVGKTASPFDFRPNEFDAMGLVSAAFIKARQQDSGLGNTYFLPAIALRFHHRSDVALFDRDLQRLTNGKAVVPLRQEVNARAVTNSARLQGMAVGLLAAFAGLTAILLMAQSLARQTVLESGEHPILRALGMSRSQTFALGLIRAAGITVVGVAIAALAAWLSSGIFPFGVFRLAEPDPGLRFDVIAMLLAPLTIVLVAVVAVVIPAWRSASTAADATQSTPSRSAAVLTRVGMPTTAVAGVRLALERGRGRTAVPVRSTITIVTLGIAAMVAALTISSSIAYLLDTPRLYGKTWDKVVNFNNTRPMDDAVAREVAAQPEVEAFAIADSGAPLIIDGRRVGGLSLYNVKGSLFPPILEGRTPDGPDEIVLGTKTLRVLGKRVDTAHPQTVQIGIEGLKGSIEAKIVGRAAIPPVSNFARFGEGVVSGRLSLEKLLVGSGDEVPQPSDSIARFLPGADPKAVIARVAKKYPGLQVGDDFARRPSDVVDFGRVKGMPLILSGILGLIGTVSLAHALTSAIRRRRRDLAILKTIGFVRAQVRHAVAWQSSTLIVVAVAIGIPLGVIGGRALWNLIADGVGVVPRSQVPLGTILLVIPGALVLANLLAMWPARAAARTKPALVLRAE